MKKFISFILCITSIICLNFNVFAQKVNLNLSNLIAETKTHGVNIITNFNSNGTCDIIVNNSKKFTAQTEEFEGSIGLIVDKKRFNGIEYLYFNDYYIVDYLSGLKYADMYIEAGYKIENLREENEKLKEQNQQLQELCDYMIYEGSQGNE